MSNEPTREKLLRLAQRGKQLGLSFDFVENGVLYISTVALQLWSGKVLVVVREIEDEFYAGENYRRDDVRAFGSLEDAIRFVDDETQTTFDCLRICKGQKVFDAEMEWTLLQDA